jgi:addiction module RelB/DinJ family antitoxin
MAKTNNLHIRIDPVIQKKAEKVLRKLGMSIPEAITVFLNQVSLKGGLPFEIRLPEEQTSPKYFYGVELPDMSYDPQESFEYFREKIVTPSFKEKYDKWLNSAIILSKKKLSEKWDETMFWSYVFSDDTSYGAFASFVSLFNECGLKLEYCYSNDKVNSGIPPCVVGVYLTGSEERRLINNEKPRVFVSLCRKFRGIIAEFKEDDLQVFEVYDEETEEMMANIYNPLDPNFMTADDY